MICSYLPKQGAAVARWLRGWTAGQEIPCSITGSDTAGSPLLDPLVRSFNTKLWYNQVLSRQRDPVNNCQRNSRCISVAQCAGRHVDKTFHPSSLSKLVLYMYLNLHATMHWNAFRLCYTPHIQSKRSECSSPDACYLFIHKCHGHDISCNIHHVTQN